MKSASPCGRFSWRSTLSASTRCDDVGMNLAERDGAHFVRADGVEEFLAIFEHPRAGIPVGEAEIQHAIGFACGVAAPRRELARAAGARAESVDEPVELGERRSFEDLQSARAAQCPFAGTPAGAAGLVRRPLRDASGIGLILREFSVKRRCSRSDWFARMMLAARRSIISREQEPHDRRTRTGHRRN